MVGIDSKNENRAASFHSQPSIRAVEIVEALREIPGSKAKLCAIPIHNTSRHFAASIAGSLVSDYLQCTQEPELDAKIEEEARNIHAEVTSRKNPASCDSNIRRGLSKK